ncbi:MAG: hypothetical protein JWQ89_248 [Devosia sp.]|nr:hypothetical protein [Devosia sp.]
MSPAFVGRAAVVAALAVLLSGCAYDYLQRTDRVGFRAGNAVKANLEAQTINPAKGSMYNTKGLGKNGPVIGVPGAADTPAAQ